ncbi:MAG: HlyD family type I secretion periplasmic adaptor subunit [Rhodobacteraceae bacterium]|nr:HlyD family type I secretion periplasmic adaptor subunit [Paracoccaceae bacterium]
MTAIAHLGDVDPEEPLQSLRPVFLAALAVIASLVAAAGGWGMYARLDAAVTTHGVLFAESERKSVEHLEGGILERLLVAPGQRVREGEIVATLDATQIREQRAQLEVEATALAFEIWRLEHEEAGAASLDLATAPPDPQVGRGAMIAAQAREFDARLRAHEGQIDGLSRQIDGLRAGIAASAGQARAAERQLALWQEERALTASLVERGATPRQKLMEFDRTIALLEGERDENRNLVVAAEEDIARAEIDIETLRQQRLADIGARLAVARSSVEGLRSRLRAAGDVLARHELRAPQDGVVVDIRTVTPGAVVASGAPLMEIVPDGDRLVALVQLPPDAIDTVYPGRSARIRLTAYRRALAPTVDGEVIYVSADLLENERDGATYFEARVSIDPAGLVAYPDVALSAGMPVEVTIEIGERRAGDYILEPFLRHLRRAFREE